MFIKNSADITELQFDSDPPLQRISDFNIFSFTLHICTINHTMAIVGKRPAQASKATNKAKGKLPQAPPKVKKAAPNVQPEEEDDEEDEDDEDWSDDDADDEEDGSENSDSEDEDEDEDNGGVTEKGMERLMALVGDDLDPIARAQLGLDEDVEGEDDEGEDEDEEDAESGSEHGDEDEDEDEDEEEESDEEKQVSVKGRSNPLSTSNHSTNPPDSRSDCSLRRGRPRRRGDGRYRL